MEESTKQPSTITMLLYMIDNDKKEPVQNWEIIPKKRYSIGRSKKEVDITLNEKLLSRKHAELVYYDNKTIMIKDLNSRNGTYINNERIDPMKDTFFSNKDYLSFGSTNNKIVFFDKNEQGQDIIESDLEKNKDKEEPKEEEDNQNSLNQENKNNKIYEEINTDIKKSYDKNKEINFDEENKDNDKEKEREREVEMEREREVERSR
jgi:pSer/pThr/pTyr-binding forkhead associated (FHA) protein